MPIIDKYIVKIIDKRDNEYNKYYDGQYGWVLLNNAKCYTLEYANRSLSLTRGFHALIKIEENGKLTKIR